MDFNLKQWRHEPEEQEGPLSLKLPKLVLNSSLPDSSAPVLPFFVPQPTTNLSALYSSSSSSSDQVPDITSTTKFIPRMGSYFSVGQWQELELQALIFRHMIAGAAVPPELLHLVKKSLITSNPPSPYYFQHYYPHHQPSLVQSGYWGRAAMDPEPGRCRRTDGKKWRCSRDVVPAQKYCERHVHRGRNRSRKPVEITTSTTNNAAGESLKSVSNNTIATQEMSSNGGIPLFTLSGPSPSMDLLHLSRRPIIETNGPFEAQNDAAQSGGARTLRHFFNDWPRSLNDADSTINSATNLSISTSDFSLKLGTGDVESSARGERERPHLNWASTWESSPMAPMGGPLAEALRSSTSNNSSPTSVLHRLARGPTLEASYVSS